MLTTQQFYAEAAASGFGEHDAHRDRAGAGGSKRAPARRRRYWSAVSDELLAAIPRQLPGRSCDRQDVGVLFGLPPPRSNRSGTSHWQRPSPLSSWSGRSNSEPPSLPTGRGAAEGATPLGTRARRAGHAALDRAVGPVRCGGRPR